MAREKNGNDEKKRTGLRKADLGPAAQQLLFRGFLTIHLGVVRPAEEWFAIAGLERGPEVNAALDQLMSSTQAEPDVLYLVEKVNDGYRLVSTRAAAKAPSSTPVWYVIEEMPSGREFRPVSPEDDDFARLKAEGRLLTSEEAQGALLRELGDDLDPNMNENERQKLEREREDTEIGEAFRKPREKTERFFARLDEYEKDRPPPTTDRTRRAGEIAIGLIHVLRRLGSLAQSFDAKTLKGVSPIAPLEIPEGESSTRSSGHVSEETHERILRAQFDSDLRSLLEECWELLLLYERDLDPLLPSFDGLPDTQPFALPDGTAPSGHRALTMWFRSVFCKLLQLRADCQVTSTADPRLLWALFQEERHYEPMWQWLVDSLTSATDGVDWELLRQRLEREVGRASLLLNEQVFAVITSPFWMAGVHLNMLRDVAQKPMSYVELAQRRSSGKTPSPTQVQYMRNEGATLKQLGLWEVDRTEGNVRFFRLTELGRRVLAALTRD